MVAVLTALFDGCCLQAVTWIKRTYEKENLTVKTLNEADFMKHLELAIQFGNPFLFENIGTSCVPYAI